MSASRLHKREPADTPGGPGGVGGSSLPFSFYIKTCWLALEALLQPRGGRLQPGLGSAALPQPQAERLTQAPMQEEVKQEHTESPP